MAAVVNIKLTFQNSNFLLDKSEHGGVDFPLDFLVHGDDPGVMESFCLTFHVKTFGGTNPSSRNLQKLIKLRWDVFLDKVRVHLLSLDVSTTYLWQLQES